MFFTPGASAHPVMITILDDSVVENPELFNVVLNSTDPSVRMPDATSVLIIDDDGMFYLLWIPGQTKILAIRGSY